MDSIKRLLGNDNLDWTYIENKLRIGRSIRAFDTIRALNPFLEKVFPRPKYEKYEKYETMDAYKHAVGKALNLLSMQEDLKIIIGGSMAMYLHGYELLRIPSDLDLRLYSNSSLELKSKLQRNDFKTASATDFDFVRNIDGLKCEIIIPQIEPKNLLKINYSGVGVYLESIDRIISYKVGYAQHNNKHLEDIIHFTKQMDRKNKFGILIK